MKSESIEDLKDKSVSWGTMRSEDLIPKFLGVLKQYAPDNYDAYVKANPEVLDLKGMDDETLGWVVDELFDELDKIAPEGTYFGAHPGDGADYGFWSTEQDESNSTDDKVVPDEKDFEKCPYCGSHNTDIRYDVDLWAPADVLAYATCKDCGKDYHGQFIFTGAYYGKDGHDYDPIDTCPFCGSKDHTETVQFDGGGYVDQDFKCKSCGGTWYNSFVWSDTQSAFESHTHKSETKQSESVSSMVKKILKDKPEVMLTDDAVNEYDDYDEMLDDLEGEQDYIHIGSNGNNEDMIFRYNADKNLIVVGDLDVDSADADAALSLVQDFVDGKLKLASSGEYDENSDFIAIIDGMTYTAYVYIRGDKDESKKPEGKDDKDCKGKGCDGSDEKCGGDKKKENRGKPQEGPGAGYDVTFEDVDVKDVSVTFNEAKDAFDVALKISARMNAEGYDWDTQYYRERMGYEPEDDEITLKFSLPNSSLKQDWADMDMADASIEEKVKALDEAFHNIDLKKFGYGGGWSHSGFNPGYVDNVLVYPFEYDGAYIEPCQSNSSLLDQNTYIPLEMDVQGTFAQDVEGACNYSSDLYEFTEKVRDIVKDLLPEQEISDSDISDERCEDYFTGGWDAEDAAEEIADELRDSSESKKSEEADTQEIKRYADKRWINPDEFVKYVRKAAGESGADLTVSSVVSTDLLDKALQLAEENDYKSLTEQNMSIKSKKSESDKNEGAYLDGSMSNAEFMSKLVDNAPNSLVFNKDNNSSKNTYTISANPDFGKSSRHALMGLNADDDKYEVYTYLYNNDAMTNPRVGKSFVFKVGSDWNTFITTIKELFGFVGDYIKRGSQTESKKSEGTLHDAYYAKALQAVDRAIKMTHDQFDITGDVAKFDADLKKYLVSYVDSLNDTRLANIGLLGDLRDRIKDFARGDGEWWKDSKQGEAKKSESKKSESLTLKQKELKDMVRYGEAVDITGISDAEAKELKHNGIELVGVSRGVYGMNGALLRGSDGKLYAITARSSNLFYFV